MGAECLMCGRAVHIATLPDLVVQRQVSEEGEDLIAALAAARGGWTFPSSALDVIASGWDDDDQPTDSQGRRIVNAAIEEVTCKIPEIKIVRDAGRIRLAYVLPPQPAGSVRGVHCAMCGGWLSPSLVTVSALAIARSIPDQQARILTALWGRTQPVSSWQITQALYRGLEMPMDPAVAYQNTKIAMCRLRKALNGTGVGVLSAGYGGGFHLVTSKDNTSEFLLPQRSPEREQGSAKNG